jgi:hypothetical protein
MSPGDKTRAIIGAQAIGPSRLRLTWSDATLADLDLAALLDDPAFAALHDPVEFARVQIGDWGHSLLWPNGPELSAETLWLETLTAVGRDDTRKFLEWRLRHALSLSKAAEALGVSRRMVAYYSNGEKTVPRPILLACLGWEASCAA